jgi:hypothetical protein
MSVCINAMSNMKFFHEEQKEAAVFSIAYLLMIGTLLYNTFLYPETS